MNALGKGHWECEFNVSKTRFQNEECCQRESEKIHSDKGFNFS